MMAWLFDTAGIYVYMFYVWVVTRIYIYTEIAESHYAYPRKSHSQ